MSAETSYGIKHVFEYLDRSRHLPGFRLEPHVAPFFGLYLVDILNASNITKPVRPMVIPEFPLRRGEFSRFKNDDNQNGAKHVDYVAISNDSNVAYFVELKTDATSITKSENQYLYDSQELNFHDFVQGIFKIATASKSSKRKYVHLLHQLSQLQLVRGLDDVYGKSFDHGRAHHGVARGWTAAMTQTARAALNQTFLEIEVIFILPCEQNSKECADFKRFIYFDEIANTVSQKDELGELFAKYLRRWQEPPGYRNPR